MPLVGVPFEDKNRNVFSTVSYLEYLSVLPNCVFKMLTPSVGVASVLSFALLG
jgi:hypothetical protein